MGIIIGFQNIGSFYIIMSAFIDLFIQKQKTIFMSNPDGSFIINFFYKKKNSFLRYSKKML